MEVHVCRHSRSAVAEKVRDDACMYTLAKQERCDAVPEVVEADARSLGASWSGGRAAFGEVAFPPLAAGAKRLRRRSSWQGRACRPRAQDAVDYPGR